ncbi:oligosaccharide flippase family protein, partial [Glaesserella parasuis]|nr:oligosaccharide flippase family protein [Glaesserella parasuis]
MHKKFLNNKLIKNAVSLGILQISNYVFPLLIWPLLAKFLGVENFGLAMIVFSILTLAYMFTDFGFNISVTHLVAQYYNDRQRIGVLLGNIFLIKLILSVIVSVATTAYILVELSDKIDLLALIFINITIFSQAFHCIWFFQGIERMGVITKVNIIAKIGYTILVFIILSLYQHINVVF